MDSIEKSICLTIVIVERVQTENVSLKPYEKWRFYWKTNGRN